MPAEAPVKEKVSNVKPTDKVLVFSVVPGLTISIEKVYGSGKHDGNGREIKKGRSRYLVFDKHLLEVEMRDMNDKVLKVKDESTGETYDQLLHVGLRNAEGYGRDFFECIRTPGMDPKAESLVEIEKRSPNQMQTIIENAKQRNQYANGDKSQPLNGMSLMRRIMEFEVKWKAAHPE